MVVAWHMIGVRYMQLIQTKLFPSGSIRFRYIEEANYALIMDEQHKAIRFCKGNIHTKAGGWNNNTPRNYHEIT